MPHLPRNSLPARAARLRRRGFTLVEITLALGIIAFAVVPLLGLMSVGVNSQRAAMDATVAAQVVQRLAGEAQLTDFDSLTTLPLPLRYFDQQGGEVAAGGSGAPGAAGPAWLYDVQQVVTLGSPAPASPDTPAPARVNSARLEIRIANNPGHDPAVFSGGTGSATKRYTTYAVLVTRSN